MKMPVYRPRSHPSRFERQARRIAIAVAAILLGFTAIEMAVVSKRAASVQKSQAASSEGTNRSQ